MTEVPTQQPQQPGWTECKSASGDGGSDGWRFFFFCIYLLLFSFKAHLHMLPLLLLLWLSLEKWQALKKIPLLFFCCFFHPLHCAASRCKQRKSKKHNSARNAICVQYGETIKNAVYNERAAGLMKRLWLSTVTLHDPHMKRDAVDRMPTKPPSCRFEVTQKNSAIWRCHGVLSLWQSSNFSRWRAAASCFARPPPPTEFSR